MPQDKISVIGARVHNLKNVSVEIPRDKLVVISGISGSGKSSLAFDTIFAEGQRRYVESLSAYARQFLGQLDKPDVDSIDGLSPAVSIDQKGASHNPRSTVGTVTEVYDYLRLLFARVGVPHCPICGREVRQQSAEEIVDAVEALPDGTRLLILAPLVRGRKGTHQNVIEDARRSGFARLRVNGAVVPIEDEIELDRYKNHTIEAVIDRLVVKHEQGEEAEAHRTRLTELGGDGVALGQPDDDRLAAQGRGRQECSRPAVLGNAGLSGARHDADRDRAAHVLLQHTPRRLPRVPGAGHQARD